jgi:alpha/beta superfamily hydrolase
MNTHFRRSNPGIDEEPLSCEGSLGPLHTMWYRGRGLVTHSVIIAPPDGEERDWAVRPFVAAARVLASHGCSVLRFDYYGQGESEGDYEETTMETRVHDLLAVMRTMRERSGCDPVIIGARLGAAVALLAANQLAVTPRLALWEPVLDTDQYLQQLLRVNLSTQMVTHGAVVKERPQLLEEARAGSPVSVNGYRVTGGFADSLLAVDAIGLLRQIDSALIVTTGALSPAAKAMAGVTAARVQGPQFWKEPKAHSTATTPFLAPTWEWLQTVSVSC